MKFLVKIFMGFFLVLTSCNQDEDESVVTLSPTAEQNGFALVYTSTTCGICGGYGIPRIEEFASQANKGAVVAVHTGAPIDPMSNQDFVNQFSVLRELGNSIPKIWVGDSSYHHSDQGAMYDLLNSGAASAGIDFNYKNSSGKFDINCAVKIFKPQNGDYYLSIFLLEDGIDGSSKAPINFVQNGTFNSYPNDDFKHNYVLRKMLNNSVLGENLGSGFVENQVVTHFFSIPYYSSQSNIYPVAVLWRFEQGDTSKIFYINSAR